MGIKSSHIFNNKEKNEKSKTHKKSLNIKNIELIHEIQEKYKIDPMIILKKELSIACGLENGNIKIFSRKFPYSLELELKIHDSTINSIFESKIGELITSSSDKTIKLTSYNLKEKKFKIIHTFLGHKSEVYNAILLEKKFVSELYASCSDDMTIRIWKKDTEQSMLIYKNKEKVWCLLELSDYRLIFCESSSSKGLYVINYKKGIIQKKNNKISCSGTNGLYKFKNKNLFAVASCNLVYIIDDKNFQIKKIIKNDKIYFLWCIYSLSDNSLLVSGNGTYICQYNEKGKFIAYEDVHLDNIPSIIEIENDILVTCSYDRKIKFWKFK